VSEEKKVDRFALMRAVSQEFRNQGFSIPIGTASHLQDIISAAEAQREDPRIQEIHNRPSYQDWTRLAKEIEIAQAQNDNGGELLRTIYRYMDRMSAFGTLIHSQYSKESLELLIQEIESSTL